MKPPVIIWADEWYPVIGGLEKALDRTANALIRHGMPVIALTRKDGRNRSNLNYPVIEVPSYDFIASIKKIASDCKKQERAIIYCARLFKGQEIKQLYALKSIQHLQPYTVLRIPSTWSTSRYSSSKFTELIESTINHFICLNNKSQETVKKRFPSKKVSLVYNWKSSPNHINSYKERGGVVWAGRFVPSKNIVHLLEAWVNIENQYLTDGNVLTLFGGEYQNTEYRKIIDAKISKSVDIVMGGSYRTSSRNILSNYRYVALPSYREGCSNILVEAFATSTPVIGTDIPGIGEHISEGRGVLINRPFNTESITRAIFRALSIKESEYIQIQTRIRSYHASYFAHEEVAEILEAVHAEIFDTPIAMN